MKQSAMLLALALGAFGCIAPAGAKDIELNVASTAVLYPQFYPLAVAEAKGYFKQQGLSIKTLATGGGGGALAPVISGDTPIGLSPMSATVLAALHGAPVKVVCGVSPNFLSTIVYAVLKSSNIHHLSDLKGTGAKIGYTSGGSITDVASAAAVKAEHLKEGKDVVRVALGSMQAETTALLTGQVKVVVSNANVVAKYVVAGKVDIIADTTDYLKNYEANAITANADFLKNHPETARKFLKAYSEGTEYGNTNKAWVQKLYAKRAGVPLAAAQIILKKLSWTTKIDYDRFATQMKLLKQLKKVPASLDDKELFRKLVDLSYLP